MFFLGLARRILSIRKINKCYYGERIVLNTEKGGNYYGF